MQKRIRESYSKLEYHIFMTECYMNISLNVRIQILEIRKCTVFFFSLGRSVSQAAGCVFDTVSLLSQARPRLQRGGSSASLHNSLMRNSIFQLMIHTLDPLSEGELVRQPAHGERQTCNALQHRCLQVTSVSVCTVSSLRTDVKAGASSFEILV